MVADGSMPSIFAALLLTGWPSRLRLEMLELLDRCEDMELEGKMEDMGVSGGEAYASATVGGGGGGEATRYGS